MLGNLAQLTIWAVVFWLLGEFDSFVAAVYHSAVNFATLGYGDLVMSEQNRFLGPLEAINGVLMVGSFHRRADGDVPGCDQEENSRFA